MRFSLVSLLLMTLIAAIFLAAWNQPTALSAHACTALFAATLMASSVIGLIRRDQRRWMACGFAVTGFLLSLMLFLGKPVQWRDLAIDRLVLSPPDLPRNRLMRQQVQLKYIANGSITRYERIYGPYDLDKQIETVSGSMTSQQARLEILHAITLFSVALIGGAIMVVCRRWNASSVFFFVTSTIGATAFNACCMFIRLEVGLCEAITGTMLALILSILLAFAARQTSIRFGSIAFVLVAGALFFEATSKEIDYTTPLPKSSTIGRIYDALIPTQKQARIGGVITDGVSVTALSVNPDGIFDVEFAAIVHCFVATGVGSLAALGTVLAVGFATRLPNTKGVALVYDGSGLQPESEGKPSD